MKFPPPPLQLIRAIKGEYFTRRDVTCPKCLAKPLERCRTIQRCKCMGKCGCVNKSVTTPPYDHSPRGNAGADWLREMKRLGVVKELRPVPLGIPSWAQWYDRERRDYYAVMITKSVKRSGGAR